jgi:hypothetical protein
MGCERPVRRRCLWIADGAGMRIVLGEYLDDLSKVAAPAPASPPFLRLGVQQRERSKLANEMFLRCEQSNDNYDRSANE